ncbi:MAG: flagellar hook-basal body complex protein [Candidatus Gastranaerophilales bacterium]|nr:flagellar hook-basal body complex protein [Candidatus Gastranaerophilales bacterium]
MKLYGGIYFDERGLSTSIRGMHMQTSQINNIAQNIAGFDKPGYQRIENVVSSFSEYVGVHGLSTVVDDKVGRIYATGHDLDLALAKKGYFQYVTPNGVKLTRDGRFKMDKNGYLLTNENYNVLGKDGMPIRFVNVPDDLKHVKISTSGDIEVYNKLNGEMEYIASLGIVDKTGSLADEADVRQGYIESSNVRSETEIMDLVPMQRNFQANRQMFITQNNMLNKTIQSLSQNS